MAYMSTRVVPRRGWRVTGVTRCLFPGSSSSTLLLLEGRSGASGASRDKSSAMESSSPARSWAPSMTHPPTREDAKLFAS
eukprot:scaffold65493_cov63-Phaeocystis_antarctica.AAC.2